MSSGKQFQVIAGPYRYARRYAESMGWTADEYVIIVRGHQLATLDPARVAAIITVKLHTMGQRVVDDIREEIDRLRALWPVPMQAAR